MSEKVLPRHDLAPDEKRALLSKLLRRQDVVSPLSHGQQALWFLSRIAPESAAYNSTLAIRLRCVISASIIGPVLRMLAERHAALRTAIGTLGGDPIQCIRIQGDLDLTEEDASTWSEEMLRQRVDDQTHRPFDLARDSLVRCVLYNRAVDDHVLVLIFHHIIGDFLSFALLFEEFVTILFARIDGVPATLPPVAAPYTEYVRYQSELLRGVHGARQLAYWEQQLAGDLPRLDLSDRPRPAVQTDRGAVLAFTLDPQLTGRLQVLAQSAGSTLYVVLLAAFQVLLHRYTAEKDIVVGSFAHGRTRPEFSRTIGYFVNPIALRTPLADDPSFSALITRVRQVVLGALEHQDYPFPLLVKHLGLAHDGSYSPVFQVAFNMLKPLQSSRTGLALSMLNPDLAASHAELPRLEHNGLIMEPFPIRQRAVQFDLEFTLDEAAEGINGFLAYNVDLFFPQTIRRIADHFRLLLEGIVADPGRRISEIPLLPEAEQQRILYAWNNTRAAYPDHACLHHLFEQQARRTPDNVAVIHGDDQCTYAELDARANRLARHLRALGVGPETPVGVCIDRSVELVVALLGILKSGGAYLPVEIDAPPARIVQMLHDARAPLCLVRSPQWSLPAEARFSLVDMDQPRALLSYPITAPTTDVTPDNLVSIYYTSGSTGRPKGVANTHQGWVNRMAWMQQRYGLAPHETVLQKTTLTFDDAAVEFFWPLSVGARIAMLEPGLHRDPRAILDAAIRYQVAVLQFVPSMLVLFLESITPHTRHGLQRLRQVISSGEALRPDLVRLFKDRLECGLHNQWGPTEASIDATAHTCTLEDAEAPLVPIGCPIANTRVYILDERCRPMPVGVTGELYVAGVGLARGYLGDAARTAEAFVPHPFEPGHIMYRTGDRGYYQSDGSIIFLGRRDDQVKIRGQRVELAEIEATLAQHPAIQDGAVIALKQADGYRLVAYFVPHAPAATEASDVPRALRQFLKERLPEYMAPGWFVPLTELPRTTSGKIDRKRLPLPTAERPSLEQSFREAQTPAETALVSIWQLVLGLTQIGVDDDFFELGGHSLDATRVVSRIQQQLQVDVPLRQFFETPTIAQLARWIDQARAGGTRPSPPITRLPRHETYELSHAQGRYWFQYQFDPANAYGTVLALDFDGALDTAALTKALHGLVERHGILRTTYLEKAGIPCQVVHENLFPSYQCGDLTDLTPDQRAAALTEAVVEEKLTPFDLTNGPLLRLRLYGLAEGRQRLLLALHPVVFDGWSVTVLIDDLQALYHAYRNGLSAASLPPAVQYVDYAAWLNGRLREGDLEPQHAYWLEQLADAPAALVLPRDFTVSPSWRAPLTHRFTDIDVALAARLHELSRAHGATLYMTLLAGLDMWLAGMTGETDIVVGSPLSGRTREELEGLFGVLWNPVAVRANLEGNPSYLQVLERVRAAALGAYANQEYPFDLVVKDLRERYGKEGDLYSIVLVVQNASEIAASFDGVEARLSRSDFLLNGRDPIADKLGDKLHEAYDLHIEIFDIGSGLRAVTRYNPRHFHPETVDGFLEQYVATLHRIVDDPHLRLSQLQSSAPPDLDDLFEDAAGVA